MIIADNGIIIRTAATGISKIGRDTKGVTIMKLGDAIVKSVAVVPHAEEEPEGEETDVEEAVVEGAEGVETAGNTAVDAADTESTETADNDEE